MSIDLKSFVADALVEIAEGVVIAQEKVRPHGATLVENSQDQKLSVDFDIAVTASSSADGGGGVKLWLLNAGAKAATKDESVHRLRFTLPLSLRLDPEALKRSTREYLEELREEAEIDEHTHGWNDGRKI